MENRVCLSSDENDHDLIQKVKKEPVEELLGYRIKRELQSCKRKRPASHLVEVNPESEVSSPAMVQAHRDQLTLANQSATFTKSMSRAQVKGGEFPPLSLPLLFCRSYLSKDDTCTLEDEKQNLFEVKYLSKWMQFVDGWYNFAVCQKLQEGDVLRFHLVGPTRFKVDIIRAGEEINASSSLVEQNGQGVIEPSRLSNLSHQLGTFEEFKSKHVKLLSTGNIKVERKQSSPAMFDANRMLLTNCPSFRKSVKKYVHDLRLPGSFCNLHLPNDEITMILEDENDNHFKVKYIPKWNGFCGGWRKFFTAHNLHEDDELFFYLVNQNKFKVYITRANDHRVEQGATESSANFQFTEFDEHSLRKYYELCCAKNVILHDKMQNVDCKLLAIIIRDTVNIADAVKGCDVFTPTDQLEQWVKVLKSFEGLGMKVDFLVNRVSQLLELRVEGTQFDEIEILEEKNSELKALYEKVGGVIKRMKVKAAVYKVKFQEVINSPW